MSAIAALVIEGLIGVGTALISGSAQKNALNKGEALSREQYAGELAQRNRELAQQKSLTMANIRENRRQFNESLMLNKEQLAATKNEYAHNAFREHATSLTGILDKNESLKSLYLNRMKGLRG